MKCLRKLLCMAVALLWVLPVSAMEWNQHARAKLDLSGLAPELEWFEPMSEWIGGAGEYSFFDSAEYELYFELHNAVWDNTAPTNLVIEAFDETGLSLDSRTFEYVVSTAFIPNVLTIHPNDQSTANTFVQSLSANEPATRYIQIRPTLILDQVRDCNQQVTMQTWFRYGNALVGTDRPDHMVVPSALAC